MKCSHRSFVAIVFLLSVFNVFSAQAQTMEYTIDLINIKNDQVKVECEVPSLKQDEIVYQFPKIIPGTYAVEDYGKYIEGFKALTRDGRQLQTEKIGNNTYKIKHAKEIVKISYLVNDAMDMNVKENKIFEPASTNIEEGKNFLLNNGGFIGYVEGMENTPHQIAINKPKKMYAATSMQCISSAETQQVFTAPSYHTVVDCPILVAAPDTVQFMVNNTKVTIACYDKKGTPRASAFYKELKRDMDGIAKFLPKLPVDNYTFLLYVDDFEAYGKILSGEKRPGIGQILELYRKFKSLGVGALEHGNSSCYYLANFGETKMKDLNLINQFTGAAIHEFMHIVTPLSLHSREIGNFNYANPKMSKHLWLYEGCTEYFAQLIKLQAGIYSEEQFFGKMRTKVLTANSYPVDEMSFTTMSENVLDNPYKKQYIHVYDRGAVIAMLLDCKIIELTKGKKNLRDVILALKDKYGKDKSFDDATFFNEFVKEVHPSLATFFDNYVAGNMNYSLDILLKPIGVTYQENALVPKPRNPASTEQNEIEYKKKLFARFRSQSIKKVGANEWAGLRPGDEVARGAYTDAFVEEDAYVKEGTTVQYKVNRNGKEIQIPIKVKYIAQPVSNYISKVAKPTDEQQRFWKKYYTNVE